MKELYQDIIEDLKTHLVLDTENNIFIDMITIEDTIEIVNKHFNKLTCTEKE